MKVSELVYDENSMDIIQKSRILAELLIKLSTWIGQRDRDKTLSKYDLDILKEDDFYIIDKLLFKMEGISLTENTASIVQPMYEYMYEKLHDMHDTLSHYNYKLRISKYDYHDICNNTTIQLNKIYGEYQKVTPKYYNDLIKESINKVKTCYEIFLSRLKLNPDRGEAFNYLYQYIVDIRDLCIKIIDNLEIEN